MDPAGQPLANAAVEEDFAPAPAAIGPDLPIAPPVEPPLP